MALGFCSLLIGIFYVRTLLHQPPMCTTRAVHWKLASRQQDGYPSFLLKTAARAGGHLSSPNAHHNLSASIPSCLKLAVFYSHPPFPSLSPTSLVHAPVHGTCSRARRYGSTAPTPPPTHRQIYTYDRYDPSRLQVGICAEPQAVHRILWGSTHQTSEEGERSRASNADERCVSAVSTYA